MPKNKNVQCNTLVYTFVNLKSATSVRTIASYKMCVMPQSIESRTGSFYAWAMMCCSVPLLNSCPSKLEWIRLRLRINHPLSYFIKRTMSTTKIPENPHQCSLLQSLSPIALYLPFGITFVGVIAAVGTCFWIYSSYLIWEFNFAKKRVTRYSKESPSNKDVPKLRNRTSIITMVQDLARRHQKASIAFHIRPLAIKRRKIGHLNTKSKGKLILLCTTVVTKTHSFTFYNFIAECRHDVCEAESAFKSNSFSPCVSAHVRTC